MVVERAPELSVFPEASLEETANLFSVVGNEEWKGIFLPQMRPGVGYSIRTVYFLVNEMQGEGGIHIPEPKVSRHLKKLRRLGVLERDPKKAYYLTEYGYRVAIPFVGHVLAFSEGLPEFRLEQLFGPPKSTARETTIDTFWGEQPYRKTAQIARLRIITALSMRESFPMRETDLSMATGEPRGLIGSHMEALARDGIITLKTVAADSPYALFGLAQDRPKIWPSMFRRNGVLRRRDVYGVFLEHSDKLLTTTDIVLALEDHLGKKLSQEERTKLARGLRHQTLPYLAREGYINYAGSFKRGVQSEVTLELAQKMLVDNVASLIGTVSRYDDINLGQGRRLAIEITSDPRRVASLVGRSAAETDNVESEEGMGNKDCIARIVRNSPGVTVRGILSLLKSEYRRRLTTHTIRDHLFDLEAKEDVEGMKFKGKKSMQWYPKNPTQESIYA